jgi:hypothetical protein
MTYALAHAAKRNFFIKDIVVFNCEVKAKKNQKSEHNDEMIDPFDKNPFSFYLTQ